eukprot:UC4_evm1s1090
MDVSLDHNDVGKLGRISLETIQEWLRLDSKERKRKIKAAERKMSNNPYQSESGKIVRAGLQDTQEILNSI